MVPAAACVDAIDIAARTPMRQWRKTEDAGTVRALEAAAESSARGGHPTSAHNPVGMSAETDACDHRHLTICNVDHTLRFTFPPAGTCCVMQ